MLRMVFIHTIRGVRQGRIVAEGTSRPRLDALVQQGKGGEARHPTIEALARRNVRRVKIQRQLGGDAVVPEGVRIFCQLCGPPFQTKKKRNKRCGGEREGGGRERCWGRRRPWFPACFFRLNEGIRNLFHVPVRPVLDSWQRGAARGSRRPGTGPSRGSLDAAS